MSIVARHSVQKARSTRERIVVAAAAAFAREGFNRASLERIALTAGVTRGAVYVHFEGKRDLFNAVGDLIEWPLQSEHTSSSVAGEVRPIVELRRTVQALMEDIQENAAKRCVLDIVLHKIEWTEENAELLDRLNRTNDGVARRIGRLLSNALRRGDLCLPISAEEASVTLQAALLGVVSSCLRSSTTEALVTRGDWLVTSLLARHES
ncbi:MAG: TetR family transcriptional regulator [Pseudomonadota bacterium]